MKHKILLVASIFTLKAQIAFAQSVPSLINYQGRLTDQTGAALPSANYGLQFRLWDSATNAAPGGLIWAQQQNVSVQANGLFNVMLGAAGGSAVAGPTPAVDNLAFAFTSSNRFLGLTVVSSNGTVLAMPREIAPRQQFLSVPFAVKAASADAAAIAASVLPGSITNGSIQTGAVVKSVNGLTDQVTLSADAGITLSNNGNKDRKSTRLNSSHIQKSRMPSSA